MRFPAPPQCRRHAARPALPLLTISLTGNLMGDWLRDALDPRLRNVR